MAQEMTEKLLLTKKNILHFLLIQESRNIYNGYPKSITHNFFNIDYNKIFFLNSKSEIMSAQ